MIKIYVLKDSTGTAICKVLSSQDIDDLISKGIAEAVSFPPYTADEQKTFVDDYTELIARLNLTYKDHSLWWATDLSSKNRYTCPVPDMVQELLDIERAFKAYQDKPLLIVAPSIGIYAALQKMAGRYGRELLWPGAGLKACIQCVKGGAKSLLRLFLRAGRFLARTFWARISLGGYARRQLTGKKDLYVIKTFSYPNSWDSGEYRDEFFGRLPRHLSQSRNVLILSYHWHGFRRFLTQARQEKTLTILPVEYFLNIWDILRALGRILMFRVNLPSKIEMRGLDVSDILRFELARTNYGIQIFQLLHYDAMRRMLKELNIGTFLFTFENNPWERMCILACRDHSPATRVIGYQHSVVPQAALNMFVHPSEKNIVPLPQKLLTTGDVPKNILRHYGDYGQVPVISSCALRYEYLFDIRPASFEKSQGRVLLLLDGIDQTRSMLMYALEQIKGQGRYQLRIRCHPALPWDLISRKFQMDVNKYPNVAISTGALQQDLAWADMVMYWQSSVILGVVNMGKLIINFKTDDLLSYDPLFELDQFKTNVTQRDSLPQVIANIEHMEKTMYRHQLQEARAFIDRYFHPVTDQALQLFI